MENVAARIRALALALGLIGATLIACASAQAASPWGKLNSFSLPISDSGAIESGHIVVDSEVAPQFAAGTDGSYYMLDSPNEGEFRLQRFTKGNVEASISFTPLTKAEKKEAKEGAGREGVGATLAVDPGADRVYVLTHYERRARNKKEEVEEEETGKPVFPLDAEINAAGSLYAFEYETGHLKSVKEKENELKTGKEPAPVISRTAFAAPSEAPKEALLDPRGMAVDPETGNDTDLLVVAGEQDGEANQKVREGKPKQCRPAVQFVTIEEKEESGHKVIKAAKLGRRYVDNNAKNESAILRANGQNEGCGEETETEEAVKQAPLSPVFAPGGGVLVAMEPESEINQIWEMAPAQTGSQTQEEVEASPQELYSSESLENVLAGEESLEQGEPMMSLVSESATDGTIYLDAKGQEGPSEFISGESTPLVLHYHRPAGGEPTLSEVGWTAGEKLNSDLGPQACSVHVPEYQYGQGSIALAGLGSGKYLGFTTYVEQEGPNHEIRKRRAEVVEFGEGGSISGCPVPAVTTPAQSVAGKEVHSLFAGPEKIEISSYLNRIENGVVKIPALANPKSVEWTIEFTGPKGEKEEKHSVVEYPLGGEDPLKLAYAFEHPGTYEITDVVHTDALAGEVVQPPSPDKINVIAKELAVKIGVPKPRSVRAHEEEAEFTAKVEDTTVAPGTELTLASVTWQLGEEAPIVLGEQKLANGGTLTFKHALGRCKTANCKVEVTVREKGGEAFVGHSEQAEISVTESKSEEAARLVAEQQEREAREAKEAEEARHAKEAQEAAQHAKEAEEAAARHKSEEEVAAHKKAEEEAAAKKHKEEEEKAKKAPPTRAQLLAKALVACHKQPKKKRKKCEASAHAKYAPKHKAKKRKK